MDDRILVLDTSVGNPCRAAPSHRVESRPGVLMNHQIGDSRFVLDRNLWFPKERRDAFSVPGGAVLWDIGYTFATRRRVRPDLLTG